MRPLRHLRQTPRASLLPVLEAADLRLGNLEVGLTAFDSPGRPGLALRADPGLRADVLGLHFDGLSLANNHVGDHGWESLQELGGALESGGTAALGVGADAGHAFAPRLVGGCAVVTVTCVGHEHIRADGRRPGMAQVRITTEVRPDLDRLEWEPGSPAHLGYTVDTSDRSRLLDAVAAARRLSPAVVVLVHWGVSYQERPESYQRDLAADFAAAGASAVFGCHSHVLGPVAVLAGTPVFSGLGSFIFGYSGSLVPRMSRDTSVAVVELDGRGRALSARLLVGRLDAAGEPVRAHPERVAYVAEALQRHGAGWAAALRRRRDVLEVDLDPTGIVD